MTFDDLKFEIKNDGMWKSKTIINGLTLSVIAGEFAYSTPRVNLKNIDDYHRFEAAVMDENGHLYTRKIRTRLLDDVIGYMTREEINELIIEIENYENN